ncbi:MAG: outer membrane beta-barrel protein, partial [Bacteroidota bacterium]
VSRVPTGLRSAFQFEAGYSGRGVSSSNSPHSFVGSGTVKFNYLDFGTYYTQQFGNGNVSFFLLGGPTISFALNGNHQFRGQDVELDFEEQGLRQSDFGMELGFGLAAGPRKNVTLEVRYAKGFSNFSLEDADRKMTHSAFHFGFGFFL